MILPTLYSRTKLGQVQQWSIEFENGKFRTHEGIQNGTITTSEWTVCIGKNIGKKNETSPEVQAEREARAKWRKRTEKDYFEDITRIDEVLFFHPMLAEKWSDYHDEITYPCAVQPKLDGLRCTTSFGGMTSRGGKPWVTCPHIFAALRSVSQLVGIQVDGELYSHELKDDFDEITSIIKQQKPTEEDFKKSAELAEYWIYDLFDESNPQMPFSERSKLVAELFGSAGKCIKIVPTYIVNNLQELNQRYEEFLAAGFEGMMIRDLNSPYINDRTKFLLKRKEFQDKEFRLKDLLEGRGNRAGMATKAVCWLEDGRDFEAGVIGSHRYCRKLLANKDKEIGKMVTIKFQNYTPDGKPRFGKMKCVRESWE